MIRSITMRAIVATLLLAVLPLHVAAQEQVRFNWNGTLSIFDSRAVHDMDRLAAFMRMPQNRRRRAVVVAFADRTNEDHIVSTIPSSQLQAAQPA